MAYNSVYLLQIRLLSLILLVKIPLHLNQPISRPARLNSLRVDRDLFLTDKFKSPNQHVRIQTSSNWTKSQCYVLIYNTNSNNDFTSSFGPMGALATAETHRKKGLAQMALTFAAKHLRSEGLTPFAFIETHNKPSFGLFMKTGFKHTHNVFWLFWNRPQ